MDFKIKHFQNVGEIVIKAHASSGTKNIFCGMRCGNREEDQHLENEQNEILFGALAQLENEQIGFRKIYGASPTGKQMHRVVHLD